MINFETKKISEEWFETTVTVGKTIKTHCSDTTIRSLRAALSKFDEEQINMFLDWYMEKKVYQGNIEHFYADDFGLCAWGSASLRVYANGPYGPICRLTAPRIHDFPGEQNNDKLKYMLRCQIKNDIHASLPLF